MSRIPDTSREEAKEIVDHLYEAKKKFSNGIDWNKYVKSYMEYKKEHMSLTSIANLNTYQTFLSNVDKLHDPRFFNDVGQAAVSLIEETSSMAKGAGLSLDRLRETHSKMYINGFLSVLRDNKLLPLLENKKFQRRIAKYMFTGEPINDGPLSEPLMVIGDVMSTMYDRILADINEAGLPVAKRKGYFGKVTHDGNKIHGDFTNWVRALDKAYDLEKVYPTTSKMDLEAIRNPNINDLSVLKDNKLIAQLKKDSDNITKKNSFGLESEDNVFSSDGMWGGTYDSLFDQNVSGRKFQIRDVDALFDYLEKYGQTDTLSSMYESYANKAANHIALVKTFGAIPTVGMELLKKYIENMDIEPTAKKKALKEFERSFAISSGTVVTLDDAKAKIAIYIRRMSTLNYLGKAGITQLLDLAPTMVHYQNFSGETFASSMAKTAITYLSSVPEAMRGDVAKMSYLYADDYLTVMNQELALGMGKGKTAGFVARYADVISTLNGSRVMNRLSYITNMKLYMRNLSLLADGKHELSNVAKATLEKFDLTFDDVMTYWKALDKYAKGNITRWHMIPKSEFIDKGLRDDFEIKTRERIIAMLLERAKKGSPVPSTREARKLGEFLEQGSLVGEGVRAFTQFKKTALKITFDTTNGIVRENNPNAGKLTASSAYKIGAWAASATALGMLVNYLKDWTTIFDDNYMERYEDGLFTKENLINGFTKGGGGLIFGDYLYSLGDTSKELFMALMTPQMQSSLSAVSMVDIPFEFASDGELSAGNKKDLDKFLKGTVPVPQNWPPIEAFIMGLNDGQKQIVR